MDENGGDQILVTSPKKKVHRFNSGDLLEHMGSVNGVEKPAFAMEDDDDDEYIEESVEDDEETIEELVDEDEEEEDDDSDVVDSDDSDVELLEIDEDNIDVDGDDSHSEFDPLPPPIEIPQALRPAHMREEQKASNYYDDYDEDDSVDTSGDSSDGDDEVAKTLLAAKALKPTTKDDYDFESADDSSTEPSSARVNPKHKAISTTTNKSKPDTFTKTGRINKEAKDYDDDTDSDDSTASPASVAKKETKADKSTNPSDPAHAVRPTTFRGMSFSDGEGDGKGDKRGGKKPSKWEAETTSIYSQNGVSSVSKSHFSKPKETEKRTISEDRPSDTLGKADAQKNVSILRGTSSTQNASIKTNKVAETEKKEKTAVAQDRPEKQSEQQKQVNSAIRAVREETEKLGKNEKADSNSEPKDDGKGPYYSYEELRKKKVAGLDYLNREQYLSPYDFFEVFKVKRTAFETWPKWKKTKAKRAVKMF
jgi:hypothetical protein